MKVETPAHAAELNETGEYGPYYAANGHVMRATVRFPRDEEGREKPLKVGDEIRIDSWSAWCDETCRHDVPPEDW